MKICNLNISLEKIIEYYEGEKRRESAQVAQAVRKLKEISIT
jgi:predicted transcriptional regulator